MATGNIKGGKRNYARVTPPSTSTATTAADTTNITIAYTPSTLGPTATSYVLTGTSTTGSTVTATLTTSPTTVSGWTSGGSYNVTLAGQNYNGISAQLATITGLTIPTLYTLQSTYNSSGTYTVASGITQIAAYVISAGGGGGGGGGSNNNNSNTWGGGGGGGGGAAIVGFKDFTVTAGQTVTISSSNISTAISNFR